ncbi:MAG: hypothetical protein QXL82_02065 [Candidatus Aenigmatarchaeota archaeon]
MEIERVIFQVLPKIIEEKTKSNKLKEKTTYIIHSEEISINYSLPSIALADKLGKEKSLIVFSAPSSVLSDKDKEYETTKIKAFEEFIEELKTLNYNIHHFVFRSIGFPDVRKTPATYQEIVLRMFLEMVKIYLEHFENSSINKIEIIVEASRGHNTYNLALLDAVKYFIVFFKGLNILKRKQLETKFYYSFESYQSSQIFINWIFI